MAKSTSMYQSAFHANLDCCSSGVSVAFRGSLSTVGSTPSGSGTFSESTPYAFVLTRLSKLASLLERNAFGSGVSRLSKSRLLYVAVASAIYMPVLVPCSSLRSLYKSFGVVMMSPKYWFAEFK